MNYKVEALKNLAIKKNVLFKYDLTFNNSISEKIIFDHTLYSSVDEAFNVFKDDPDLSIDTYWVEHHEVNKDYHCDGKRYFYAGMNKEQAIEKLVEIVVEKMFTRKNKPVPEYIVKGIRKDGRYYRSKVTHSDSFCINKGYGDKL